MKFKRQIRLEQGLQQTGIISLAGMAFLLVILLLLAPGLAEQPGIKVDLPRLVTSEVLKQGSIEVLVSADNAIYINNKAADIRDLGILLRRPSQKNITVLIKADRHASLSSVAEIWDACRNSGVSQVSIATTQ